MSDDKGQAHAAALKYIKGYLEREILQAADGAGADPQLASAIGQISERIAEHDEGHLYDLGCGYGTLLVRLATVPAFRDRDGWTYCPVDYEDKIDKVTAAARRLKLLKRTSPLLIEEMRDEKASVGAKIFFCRNVLHELKIGEAAELIHSVCRLFGPDDLFFIQDLLRFPEGERNNHCWTYEHLSDALRTIGFGVIVAHDQGSKSGNAWFNVTARNLAAPPSLEDIQVALLEARKSQWNLWTNVGAAAADTLPERDALIAALDMDLQLASLTRELKDAGGLDLKLDPEIERRIQAKELVKRIEALADANEISGTETTAHAHFRERGTQLNIAEDFLRSTARIAVVHGGNGTGKTTFIQQLLANRLYEKALVSIDARSARGVWPMIEQLFSQLGVNLAASAISVMGHLEYDQLRAAVGKFLNKWASKLVVVVENIDEVLDSNLRFIDPQIEAFLTQVAGKDGVKVIFSSRQEFLPPPLQKAAGNAVIPRVSMGRYATTATVTNVLDDYFDRARAGLSEYPAALIEAIDNHPLVAALAGRILEQDGKDVLLDERFFVQLKQRLREELLARLVDGPAQAVMDVAAELRTPVPAKLLEALSSRQSVYHARENELLYAVYDKRWSELLNSLGLFRKRNGNDLMPASEQDVIEEPVVSHASIADQLERLYREDDDPKWIRESYYHRMLSGQTQGLSLSAYAGSYYFTELVASANYCFERRGQFGTALSLYDAARTIKPLDETSLMRRASCLIRTGDVANGSAEYRRLVGEYPSNIGMKRSHVDALLFRKEFKQARAVLKEHELSVESHVWHARQWARTELGLHNYKRAIELFGELRLKAVDDPIIVTWHARALQQFGNLDGAIDALRAGMTAFPGNVPIKTSLAQNLERSKQDEEALPMLRALFEDDEGNARAALSLVRILLRTGDRRGARRVARIAIRKADSYIIAYAHMAHAEVLLDEQPIAAAAYLREHLGEDESIGTLLIDALLRSSEISEETADRKSFLEQAANVPIPATLAHNVPVQVVLVKLAIARRDRSAFDRAISNLASTKIDGQELQRLRQLW